MITKFEKINMCISNLGWLESLFHFPFTEYHNPDRMEFGSLRLMNDDIIEPKMGFDARPTGICQGECNLGNLSFSLLEIWILFDKKDLSLAMDTIVLIGKIGQINSLSKSSC